MSPAPPHHFRWVTLLIGIAATSVLLASIHEKAHRHDGAEDTLPGIVGHSSRFLTRTDDDGANLPPLFPLQLNDYIGLASAICGLMLAAGGGIGGGGILVPIYILILQFPVKYAIPLASTTVLGGAVANNLLNASRRHPDHPSRPLTDWELILQLTPLTMAGALVGANLNDVLPAIVLVLLLLLLLTVTAYKTLQEAVKLYQKESQQLQNTAAEQERMLSQEDDGSKLSATTSTTTTYGAVNNSTLNLSTTPSFGDDKVHQVWIDAIKLTTLFAIVTTLNLLKGGGHTEEGGGMVGLPACGAMCYWCVEAAILLVIVLFAWYVRSSLLRRIESGSAVLSEISWNEKNTLTYPALMVASGLMAGLFGIGGGILNGPIMLALGVHPAVASASLACMVLFTSATATISYATVGLLTYDYAAMCALIGFGATVAGQTVMRALMKHYQRNSYIAFAIGIVVGLSAICMTIESVVAIRADV